MITLRNYFLLLLSAFLIIDCHSEKKEIVIDQPSAQVLIYRDSADLATVKYNQAIMELPEYLNWEYNYNNPSRKGDSHFESRKVYVDTSWFYHIELLCQQIGKPEESTVYPEILVCYFRVDEGNTTIQILDEQKKKFLDLMSPEGRTYFKSCLNKQNGN